MFLFAAIGGGFSDVLGRKPLLFWPVFGYLVVNLMGIVEELFLETIPLEFFYVENISSFFGGSAVFYLARIFTTAGFLLSFVNWTSFLKPIFFQGSYSYITDVTNPEERAARLAR